MDITAIAKSWLTDFFDQETKKEIQSLMKNNPQELEERCWHQQN